MTLIKTSVLSAILTIIKILNGFVIIKVIAIYVGPTGLAFIGQFQNFISILMSFATGAINTGVVKYTAEYSEDEKEKQKLWSTSLRISMGATLFTGIVLIIYHNYLSIFFFKSEQYGSIFIIFAITLVFFVLNSLLLAILNGQKEVKKLIFIEIFSSFIGLILTAGLAYFFGLYGALISYTTGQAIVFIVTLFFVFKSPWFKVKLFSSKLDPVYLKKLTQYIIMAITSALTVPLSQMVIRNYIGETLSWDDAGYWDGIWKISSTYLAVITTTLSIYYLPRLSEIQDKEELKKEIFYSYKIIMPIVIIMGVVIFLLKDFIISLLFTEQFSPMKELFFYQLIGDVIKIASWILACMMVAKTMTKTFIVTEIFFSLSFVILSILFIKKFGLIGVTKAFAINYLIYLITMIFIFRSKLRNR